jgi:hypothetical protein
MVVKSEHKTHPYGFHGRCNFPHIIKVQYMADGNTYTKRKWIGPGKPVPAIGSSVTVLYPADKPGKAKILC